MLQARDAAGGRSVTVSITQENARGPATVVLAAEGPAAP
jgi:hypothetical protein